MKKIIILQLFLLSAAAYGQDLPDMGVNKVRIYDTGKTVVAEMNPSGNIGKLKADLFYYWYSANIIHSTQGGYSGRLLNGQYTEYYLNKNMKEQGTFKKGLKTGLWESWNEDGILRRNVYWKDGLIVDGPPKAFWKRLNIFKGKSGKHAADTLKQK